MAYFGVIFFANMGGGGGQNYSQSLLIFHLNLGAKSEFLLRKPGFPS